MHADARPPPRSRSSARRSPSSVAARANSASAHKSAARPPRLRRCGLLLCGLLAAMAAAAVLLARAPLANAHSAPEPPIPAVALVEPQAVHRVRHLHKRAEFDAAIRPGHHLHEYAHSGLQIRFVAFNMSVVLDLTPHLDIVHPEATFRVHTDAASASASDKPLSVYAYDGKVLGDPDSWARIVLHEDDIERLPKHPHFEGVFQHKGVVYTVRSVKTYLAVRRPEDAVPPEGAEDTHKMLVYSDADLIPRRNAAHLNGHGPQTDDSVRACGVRWTDPDQQFARQLIANAVRGVAADAANVRMFTSNATHGVDLSGGQPTDMEGDAAAASAALATSFLDIDHSGYRLHKRQAAASCSGPRRVLYFGFAADCTFSRAYGRPANVLRQLISNVNAASKIYERTFNIVLTMVKVEIYQNCFSEINPQLPRWNRECNTDYAINDRLNDFSRWRGERSNDGLGLWHLMTNCPSGTSVGIAWTDQVCTADAQERVDERSKRGVVSGTGVSSVGRDEWKIVAHEIGHNFGASHDCDSFSCATSRLTDCCQCPGCDCGGRWIMHPTDNSKTDDFSPCSKRDICNLISTKGTCLQPPGRALAVQQNQCGNGVLEPGEQCDCGDQASCAKDACCDGATCRLKPNAQCSDKNHDCCKECKVLAAGTTCRPARGQLCDFEEKCDGASPFCPPDRIVENGKSCGPGLTCASGFCTSRTAQCAVRKGDLNITGACLGNEYLTDCDVVCRDLTGRCVPLSGFYIDGTPCGYKSLCIRGDCVSPNWWNSVVTWGLQNRAAGLTILCVVSALVLIILFFIGRCIFRRCTGKRAHPAAAAAKKRSRSNQPTGVGPPLGNHPPRGANSSRHGGVRDGNAGNAANGSIWTSLSRSLQRPGVAMYDSLRRQRQKWRPRHVGSDDDLYAAAQRAQQPQQQQHPQQTQQPQHMQQPQQAGYQTYSFTPYGEQVAVPPAAAPRGVR